MSWRGGCIRSYKDSGIAHAIEGPGEEGCVRPSQAAFHMGPSWAPAGPSWAPIGPQLGLTGAHLGMLLGIIIP